MKSKKLRKPSSPRKKKPAKKAKRPLTVDERLKLLEKLGGIGQGLWKGEDAQEYVNRLRDNEDR